MQKDLFGDGKVTYDYIEGKSVTLRAVGFKIVVHKPYNKRVHIADADKVYEKAVIDFSTNTTISIDMNGLVLINRAINEAVKILNSEGYHLIDAANWNGFGSIVDLQQHPELKVTKPKTTVKTLKVSAGDLFIDKNSNMFLYVGSGNLVTSLSDGRIWNRNGCRHIYVRIYKETMRNILVFSSTDTILVNTNWTAIDTYANLKRAVKILCSYGEHKNIHLNNTEFKVL